MQLLNWYWREFDSRFPTERDCAHELLRRMDPRRIRCGHCQSVEFDSEYGDRELTCRHCRRKFSFTAGTLFHGVRRIRPWLAAIWLMERGIAFNANQLHKLLDISYSTASDIFKRLPPLSIRR